MKRLTKHSLAAVSLVASLASAPAHAEGLRINPALTDAARTGRTLDILPHLPRPDLVVQARYGGSGPQANTGFCGLTGGASILSLRVVNLGNAKAIPSKLKIDWGAHGAQQVHVGALLPGQARVIDTTFPGGLPHTALARFTITADSFSQVNEKQENNNRATGQCYSYLPDPGANRS